MNLKQILLKIIYLKYFNAYTMLTKRLLPVTMVYQGQSTQQLLTTIKQNRHYCVNTRFYLRSW
jgi:hypothetical protein